MENSLSTHWPVLMFALGAFLAWLTAVYSVLNMMAHVRGSVTRMLFSWAWWDPNKADQYFDAAGMPHYHRLKKAMVYFFAATGCIMVYVIMQIMLETRDGGKLTRPDVLEQQIARVE